MKYKDEQGNWVSIALSSLDSMPVGTIVDYDGDISEIPVGWEETNDPEIYSTAEVKTNKTWINGKPIYRKVINGITPSQESAEQNVAMADNIDEIIEWNFRINSSYGWELQNTMAEGNNAKVSVYLQPNKIYYGTLDSGYYNRSFRLIVEYTKTVD